MIKNSADIPLGTTMHNGRQLARAVAKLIVKERKSATLKLLSLEVRLISKIE